MARLSTQQQLDLLKALRQSQVGDARLLEECPRLLKSNSGTVIAGAARLCTEHGLEQFIPQLVQAAEGCLAYGRKRDPGCKALCAIVRALEELSWQDEELLRTGVCYEQWEPVWGGSVDTAAEFRVLCASSLLDGNLTALVELGRLLADHEATARVGAARQLSRHDSEGARALLCHKLKAGDEVPEVLGECAAALLALDASLALPLIRTLLRTQDEDGLLREAVVLALGASRLSAAWPLLKEQWEDALLPDERRPLLTALALLRQEESLNLLCQLLTEGGNTALEALEALATLRADAQVFARVTETMAGISRRDPIWQDYEQLFPEEDES